jgi:hypothetical protein
VATRIEWPLWRDSDPEAWKKRDQLLDRLETENFAIQMAAEDGSFVVWVQPCPDKGIAEVIVEGHGWMEFGTVCWPLQVVPD